MKLPLALAATLLAACTGGRAHIEPGHGRSFGAQFAAQRDASAGARAAKAAPGLDGQEASIIAGTYRKSLSPKEERTQAPPVLVVEQQHGGGMLRALLPSVPKD